MLSMYIDTNNTEYVLMICSVFKVNFYLLVQSILHFASSQLKVANIIMSHSHVFKSANSIKILFRAEDLVNTF